MTESLEDLTKDFRGISNNPTLKYGDIIMKRSTSAIALIAGLMMSLFGAVAHAAPPCINASGDTASMSSQTTDNGFTWFELSQHE